METHGPLVIGIAGPSASGKTALAAKLIERLAERDPVRLPLDHYYKDLAALEPELRGTRNFDHPDALDSELFLEHLRALVDGRDVDMPLYSFETHTRKKHTRLLRAGGPIVADGLHVLYRVEIRELLTLKVYLEASHELCLARRIERDTTERGRTEESVRTQYESTVRPMRERFVRPVRRFADLVLCGDDDVAVNVEHISRRLRYRRDSP